MKLTHIFYLLFLVSMFSCDLSEAKHEDQVYIQKLEEFQLDGIFEEWNQVPFRQLYSDPLGNYPEENDLDAKFKLAWKNDQLLLYFEIKDNKQVADTIYPWKGDAIELFLMEYKGSDNIIQYSIVTGEKNVKKAKVIIKDRQNILSETTSQPELSNRYICDNGYIKLELELNYNIFSNNKGIKPFAFQLYIHDSDRENGLQNKQLTWYPLGHSYMNSFAAYQLILSETDNTYYTACSRAVITDNEKVELFIFGIDKGHKIEVRDQKGNSYNFISKSITEKIPDTLQLKSENLNLEEDTLFIFIDGDFTGMHDLLLTPRIYNEEEPERFERDIRIFIAKDRLEMPEPGGVVFIGSSSIRMWNTLENDFPELNIIHRGFGGSTSRDALRYMDIIVTPYLPEAVVYYEGDNDIAQGFKSEEILENIRNFVDHLISINPSVDIYLLSPKPAIVRMHLWDRYLLLHERMKKLAAGYEQVEFVNVAKEMFENGQLREDIFIEDKLHMNEKGYKIWTEILRKAMDII